MLCHYAECRILFIVMLNDIMLSVVTGVIYIRPGVYSTSQACSAIKNKH
jgi:hypothetical protein